MQQAIIIRELGDNKSILEQLLIHVPQEQYLWRPEPNKWCLLEVICHLYDEEKEDFRTRLRYVLETPGLSPPPIDPARWVIDRKYMEQNYYKKLEEFLNERDHSVEWLRNLVSPQWENVNIHPTTGSRSGNFYLANWLEHDYLHIRQIIRLKHQYLEAQSGESLNYAGGW